MEAQAGLISGCPDIWKRALFDLGGRMDPCLFFSHSVSANLSTAVFLSPPLTACLSSSLSFFIILPFLAFPTSMLRFNFFMLLCA